MKRINKLLIVIAAFLLIPSIVLAANEQNESEGNVAGLDSNTSCAPGCYQHYTRAGAAGGVRITFVDENGKAIAESGGKSYDFITYASWNVPFNKYNGYDGDRTKFTLINNPNYKETTKNANDIPLFSSVVSEFNKNTSKPRLNINNTGYTGGNINAKYTKENDFFISITDSNNTNYVEDVNAFVTAIANVTGGFDASRLQYKIAEGCSGGQQIFIIMEPLFLWQYTIGQNNYTDRLFGTFADFYYMVDSYADFWNMNQNTYQLFYKDEIPAFKAAVGISENEFKIQSKQDLLSNAGFGLAVDWASNYTAGCSSCSFTPDGRFTYNDKIHGIDMQIPNKFNDNVAEYAFTERDKGGAGCCKLLKNQIADKDRMWQEAYDKLCKTDDENPDCCTPDEPLLPKIDVNNCCSESPQSSVTEPELDDLFCYDSNLQVSYYKNKCGNEEYKQTIPENDYCDLYCTERVQMEVPGALTGNAGMYFKLDKYTSRGTNSPYIEGYRRCRVKIYYDEWRKDYVTDVQSQVDAFNLYQKNAALVKIYESAEVKEKISENTKLKVSCYKESDEIDPNTGKKKKITNTGETTLKYSYDVYKFKTTEQQYVQVQLVDKKYTQVNITKADNQKVTHNKYAYDGITAAKKAYDDAVKAAEEQCGLGNTSVLTDFKYPEGYNEQDGVPDENPSSKKADYSKKATSAQNNFTSAINNARMKENKLDQCNYYFDKGNAQRKESGLEYITNDESILKSFYNFNPDLGFRYTEIYYDKNSKKQVGTTSINFDQNCTYELSTAIPDPNGEIKETRYADKFGKSIDSLTDFKQNITLELKTSINLNDYYDDAYKSDKRITTDGKVHVDCTWKEKGEKTYTFVPSGQSLMESELGGHSITNTTVNGYKYRIELNTFSGVYSTYWDIDKIGHKGKLTKYFKAGKTCANENVDDVVLPDSEGTAMGCSLYVRNQIIRTGICNYHITDCEEEPLTGIPQNFSFKVVDSYNNLFPTGTLAENGEEYAQNWTVSEVGKTALQEIEERGRSGKTFDPERISYQFELNPTTLKIIKKYNDERNNYGGYADFDMKCSCPTEMQTTPTEETKGCIKCQSNFITNINNLKVNGKEYKADVWKGTKSIKDVRDNKGGTLIHWSEG